MAACSRTTASCLEVVGQSCGASAECLSGSCCAGVCKDTTTDAQNCGACGVVCQTNAGTTANVCSAGACQPTCAAGWFNVDGVATNGCECKQDAYEGVTYFDLDPTFDAGLDPGESFTIAPNTVPALDVDQCSASVWGWSGNFLTVTLRRASGGPQLRLRIERMKDILFGTWTAVGSATTTAGGVATITYAMLDTDLDFRFYVEPLDGTATCAPYSMQYTLR